MIFTRTQSRSRPIDELRLLLTYHSFLRCIGIALAVGKLPLLPPVQDQVRDVAGILTTLALVPINDSQTVFFGINRG